MPFDDQPESKRIFGPQNPRWVSADYARANIQDAWIGQWSGQGFFSQLIKRATQGVHSHSAMFRRNDNGESTIDVLEMVCKGGQTKTLDYHLARDGQIDCFSPCNWGIFADGPAPFDPAGAVAAMRKLCDYNYGWRGILRMAIRRCPVLWRLYPPTTDDRLPEDGKPIRQPFCSHAVSLATHLGGGFDPVPFCPHSAVAPMDLTKSLFYRYEFTIATPWAREYFGEQILSNMLTEA